MGIITDRLKFNNNYTVYSLQDTAFAQALGIEESGGIENLGEVCYLSCLKILSESLSKIPIRVMQSTADGDIEDLKHPLNYVLKRDINPYTTNVNFLATAELLRNHYGNCFIYIERDKKAKVKHLWILPPQNVTILMDDKGLLESDNRLFYQYTDPYSQQQHIYKHTDIIHLKTSMSFDGITGLAVKDILKTQLNTRLAGQKFLNKSYANDLCGGKIVVQYTGKMDKAAERALVEGLESFKNKSASGAFIPVPMGMELNPLNINLTDAQFAEINSASALEIASAFGIRGFQLNRDGKYNNVELQQMDFYVNTLMSIFKIYEDEFTKK